MTDESWAEWRIYVVRSVDANTLAIKELRADLGEIKAAAKAWGAVTSLVVTPIIVGVVLAVISAFN